MDAREEFQEGLRLFNEGQLEDAVSHFQQSILLGDASHFAPVFNLALTYANLGQQDNALEQLRNVVNGAQAGEVKSLALELYFQLREGTFSRQPSLIQDLAGI
jgi:tetratricopeptide (TPR) repeat protein